MASDGVKRRMFCGAVSTRGVCIKEPHGLLSEGLAQEDLNESDRHRFMPREEWGIMQNGNIEIASTEFWMMLVSTLRYALGRRTYVVSDTAELIKKHLNKLAYDQMFQLHREISQELHRANLVDTLVGDKMDHEVWVALCDYLKDQMERRKKARVMR